ncbi:NAD-dependent epimerase/dehydratase family protein [Phreatobacter sp. HK31-P]
MNILVTGATGFVGAAIVGRLAASGHRVRAAARTPLPDGRHPGIEPAWLPDLAETDDLAPLVAGMDAVVHTAGLAHQPRGVDEARLHAINAAAARRLASAAAAQGVERFLLVSSIRAISGPASALPLGENASPSPSDAYGRSKQAGELAVAEALPSAIILRPPVIHGAGAKANMARLADLARLRLPLPFGGLTGRRSVLSDLNLAEAVTFLLTCQGARGRTLHISDGHPQTVGQMIAMMRAGLGRKPGMFSLPTKLTVGGLSMLAPDLLDQLLGDLVVDDSAIRALGWRPVEPSSAGLARMVRAAAGLAQTRL